MTGILCDHWRRFTRHHAYKFVLALVLVTGQGCAAPVFSDFQSARIVEEGKWELTPVVSHLPTAGQTNVGLQAAAGVGSHIEMRARYVRVFAPQRSEDDARLIRYLFGDLDADVHHASFGVKFGLLDGVLAAHLPVEVAFVEVPFAVGAGSAITTRPTLIATVPISKALEVNTSFNVILPTALASVNFGLGIGNLGTWSVRPEVGVMLNTGFTSVGVGVSTRLGGGANGRR